ncbi:hypothetical protein K1T71_004842 [Dendrolimus kikuchii]|uniref:Uncharacterized protein n=1 Tax=Dendrolimus kikuchii TaxID=765133 RepID=A0ACC1D5J8_9NEOP|nr:hypothetical protein K1T71_004842 [Dendrolimus kikuchii]
MVYKWRVEQTPMFLEHFKNYPTLWNFKTDGYKNRVLRAKAMRALIQDLNIEGVNERDVKLKIKSIRTRYTCELSKIKRSTETACSPDDIYVPKLYWFKQADEFLHAVCVPRERSSSFHTSKQQSDVTEYENSDEEQEISEDKVSEQSQKTNNEQVLASKFLASRSRKRNHDTPIDRPIKELKPVEDDDKETAEDEFDLFCRSLAVQLKKMPLQRALICQQKLQSVMIHERLKSINMSSPKHSSNDSPRSSPNIYYAYNSANYKIEEQ